ncbi:N-acetylmuramoyl-L-alanine amidase [Heyndrickxia sporothermodurans]|uniref:N-acetylmuramoyl-L-alanine amidase n=1 Tax=Heyndrickxia sporothermodurans TaxID=46224 RepID=UPI0035E1EA0D
MKKILFFIMAIILMFTSFGNIGYAASAKPPNIKKIKPLGEYTVTATSLYIRKGPSAKYKTLGYVKKNKKVKVYEIKKSWAYITYGSTKGYVSSKYLKKVTAKKKPTIVKKNTTSKVKKAIGERIVNATTLYVRKGPGTKYKSVGYLKKNKKVKIYEIKGNWVYIIDGKLKGYVSKTYLKTVKKPTPVKKTAPKPKPKPVAKPKPKPANTKPVAKPNPKPAPKPTPATSKPKPTTPTVNGHGKSYGQRIVNVSELNVRKTRSTVGVLKKGTKVTMYDVKSGWAYVTSGKIAGYVSTQYLQSTTPANRKIIVIDAGHGGKDPGASGNKLVEKEVTLNVAQRVEKLLKSAGIEVVMTRTGDTYPTLEDRIDTGVKANADTFVSIHCNFFSKASANGTETYYHNGGPADRANHSKQLATFINERLVQAIDTTNRGVKKEEYRVINSNPLAAVLVELGFLSNKQDASKLASNKYRDIAAKAIYQGILDYYKYIGK